MRGARDPSEQTCGVCDKRYFSSDGDPCPRCGGDVDVAGFHRAKSDFDAKLAEVENALAVQQAERIEALQKQLAECRTELNAKIGTLQAQLTVERANHGNTRDALAEACDKAEAYADHPTLDVHVRARIDALRKAGGL